MGDHRASIKIEMEFHGVKDHTDMWINYFPNTCCNMDQRVVDFFEDVYQRGMDVYDERIEKYREEHDKNILETAERSELERLKNKYEPKGDLWNH